MKSIYFTNLVSLTEKEEIILFLLLYKFSSEGIANFLKVSNKEIEVAIKKHLLNKFKVNSLGALIDKAFSMGYSIVIPEKILPKRI